MPRLFTSVLVIFALLLSTSGVAADAPPRTEWKVRHKLSNSPHEDGPKLLLRITDKGVQGFSENKLVLDIPASSVLAITSDDRVHRPAADWFASGGDIMGGGIGLMDGCTSAYCIPGYVAVAIVSLGVWLVGSAAISPKKTVDHFVSILWTDHDLTRQALFQVHKGEDASLLAALKNSTGKDWIDLVARREQWKAEVEKTKDHAIPIELDRKVSLNGRELDHGKYMLLALPRTDSKAELVFFHGRKAELSQIAAQAMASLTPAAQTAAVTAPAAKGAPVITYDAKPKAPAILTISTETATYAFEQPREDPRQPEVLAANSGVIPAKTDIPLMTITLADNGTIQAALVNYHGERAFRFPVVHYHQRMKKLIGETEVCRGSLYVMADHVVFDAALNMNGDRDPFDLKRTDVTEIKALRAGFSNPVGGVMVHTKQKRLYVFEPSFATLDGREPDDKGLFPSWRRTSKQMKPLIDLINETLEHFEEARAKYDRPAPAN